MHVQMMVYLASAGLGKHLVLLTKHRNKHHASTVDVHRLVDTYHTDTTHCRMNCMHLQMTAADHLIRAARMIIESNCYSGSNACLK